MARHPTARKPDRSTWLALRIPLAVVGVIGVLLLIVIALPLLLPVKPQVSIPPGANATRAGTRKQPALNTSPLPLPRSAPGSTASASTPRLGRAPIAARTNVTTRAGKAPVANPGAPTKWTPIAARMQAAMDDGDREGALIFARQLMTVPDPAIRREALDMFRWLGPEALPELTRMLADPSEQLAQLALEAWQTSLGEITDHAGNVRAVADAIATIQDTSARHALMMQISLLPDEIAAKYYAGMLDAQDKEIVELAREYLTFMAQEPIETQADVTRWIARLQPAAVSK